MNISNFILTLILTVLGVYMSVSYYVGGNIEEAQLFATWGCMALLIGIFNKEDNGKKDKD